MKIKKEQGSSREVDFLLISVDLEEKKFLLAEMSAWQGSGTKERIVLFDRSNSFLKEQGAQENFLYFFQL